MQNAGEDHSASVYIKSEIEIETFLFFVYNFRNFLVIYSIRQGMFYFAIVAYLHYLDPKCQERS